MSNLDQQIISRMFNSDSQPENLFSKFKEKLLNFESSCEESCSDDSDLENLIATPKRTNKIIQK